MSKPVAVLISDVHYSVSNLTLAEAAMGQAIDKANDLRVPLIVAGDLHDTKANLRGECVNAMIETFKRCYSPPYILIGNHDKINEKSSDHSLGFLSAYGAICDYLPQSPLHRVGYLIPYQHDVDRLRSYLKTLPKGATLIMHQGIQGSNMGDYIQDKSALSIKDVAGFRVISGHYHARQTTDLSDGGKWDYIGNPYTVSYGEADDPPKGFQILMDDGSLVAIPTNLRRHRVIEYQVGDKAASGLGNNIEGDLIWIKVSGTKEQLQTITRDKVFDLFGYKDFRLDLCPTDVVSQVSTTQNLTKPEIIDGIIDSLSNTSEERKERLKTKWKELCE